MIRTWAGLVLALVALASPVLAQPRAVAAALRGQVVDGESGAPLSRARVALATANDAVFTDDQGEFLLDATRSGLLTVGVTKAGYVAWQQAISDAGGTMRVALTRSAAVSGRVLDQYGRADSDVFVVARLAAAAGDRAPSVARQFSTQTDALGDYRLGGLPPGRFELRAMRRRASVRTPPNLSREELLFGPIMYVDAGPDTFDLTLKPGDDLQDIAFKMPGPAGDCGTNDSQRPAPGVVRASIHGRVTGVSGEPLVCVRLVVVSAEVSAHPTSTDQQGYYTIYGLPAGTVGLEASASGYLTLGYGQATLSQPKSTLTLRADEARDDIDFTLPRMAMIGGRVVDEHGEPLQGIAMSAFRIVKTSARVNVIPSGSRPVTDDRGRYRITDLRPGRYVLSATAAGQVSTGGAERTSGYAPIYYPNTADMGAATRVAVEASQQLDGVDVSFYPTPTYTVTGRVTASGGPAAASIVLAYSARSGVTSVNSHTVDAAADGTFSLTNVPAGDYVVQARAPGQSENAGPFGVAYVRVENRQPPPVELVMAPRSTVEGRLVLESTTPLARLGLSLSVVPTDPDIEPVTLLPFAKTNVAQGIDVPNPTVALGMRPNLVDERFRLTEVSGSNRFQLSFQGCRSCFVKSVSVGGADVTDAPFDFGVTGRSYNDVVVVVSDKAGSLDGRVVDERGDPVGDFLVLVFSTLRDRWYYSSPHVRSQRSASDGSFQARSLVPGDYDVALMSPEEATQIDGSSTDPEVLDALVSRAQRVTVREGQRVAVTIRRR